MNRDQEVKSWKRKHTNIVITGDSYRVALIKIGHQIIPSALKKMTPTNKNHDEIMRNTQKLESVLSKELDCCMSAVSSHGEQPHVFLSFFFFLRRLLSR